MRLPRFLTFASGSREALSRIGGQVIPCPAAEAIELPDDAVLAPGHDAVGVRCEAGNVWVTESGNPADVTLHAGEEFRPRRGGGKLVVQSLGGRSRVTVRYA